MKATQAQDTNLGVLRAQYEHAIALLSGQPARRSRFREASLKTESAGDPARASRLNCWSAVPISPPAERAVAQANAQIGIAKTAFFPNVTFSGSAGLRERLGCEMARPGPAAFGPSALVWPRPFSMPACAAPPCNSFRRTYDQTVANYRQTVLTAFQQVEDNLAALRILTQVIDQQNAAIDSAGRSLEEAKVRYKAGLDPYLNVISAQTVLLNDQEAAVNFRVQRMVAASN